MAAFQTASLVFLLVFSSSVSAGQRIIIAEPRDNVILPFRAAENKEVIVVEWSRTDLESDQYVLLYRDNKFYPEGQSPSFSNRVSLLDVKNGDVSLDLKNVTTDDRGIYECRVVQGGNNRRKRSQLGGDPNWSIDLRVEAGNQKKQKEDGGNKGGPKEDGGNKDEIKEGGGNEDGPKEDGGSKTGPIAGLSVFAVAVVVVVGGVAAVLYKKPRYSSPRSKRPPAAAADAEKTLTGPDE